MARLVPLQALVILLALAGPLAATDSKELERAAKAERARRARVASPAPVYTNMTGPAAGALLSKPAATPAPVPPAGADDAGAALTAPALAEAGAEAGRGGATATAAPGAAAPAAAPDPTAAEPPHDENWWRERMRAAQHHIEELEGELSWAQARQFIVMTGLIVPINAYREFNRKLEHDGTLADIERIGKALEVARGEPARLREQARREGAPPGWFR